MNSNVNSRLWMIVMCQYRFIGCNKCTTLMEDVDDDGSYACVESGDTWEISVPSTHIAVNLKLLLKSLQVQKKGNLVLKIV